MKVVVTLSIILALSEFAWGKSTKETLEKIFKQSGLRASEVGLYVEQDSGTPVFNLNGNKSFIPASISKLLTTAAVMKSFSPSAKFHTKLFSLDGNLYIKGEGDPAFVSEKMWMIVDELLRNDVTQVTDIIADDSYFDGDRFDEGRESERNDRAYDAPVGALSFNWNSTTIYVRPGKKAGEAAKVFIDPPNDFVTLKNDVTTSSSGTDLSASRSEKKDGDVVTVKGKIAIGANEHHFYKDISNPPLYTAANLKEFLKQRGIEVKGTYKTGTVPKNAPLLVDFEGEPLSKLINDMNKFSNNYIAEMLAKNLAAAKTGRQGTMADGLNEVRKFLISEMGWGQGNFNLENVSGFTRKNSFTAHQFVELLWWLERHFNFYPEFLQSLPIAGTDGTLQKRMKNATGWVRAKTGLLNGVVALAGYAGTPEGRVTKFAFIYNGGGQEAHVREVFDSLATALTTP